MYRRSPIDVDVDVISDDDISAFSPSPFRPTKRPNTGGSGVAGGGGGEPPTFLVIDDDPTPQKPNPNPNSTPSFVAETPLSSDVSIVKCSIGRGHGSGSDPLKLPEKFAGITGFICLESDNESEDCSGRGSLKTQKFGHASFGLVGCSERNSCFSTSPSPMGSPSEKDNNGFCYPIKQVASVNNVDSMEVTTRISDGCRGTMSSIQSFEDNPVGDCMAEDALPQTRSYNDEEGSEFGQVNNNVMKKGKRVSSDSDKINNKLEVAARKKQQKEEKACMLEERKQKRQEEKLQRETLRAEAAEKKKLEKEKQKWEKGKFAVKSIVAEIDVKVVENGSVGGHLLTRLAEKGISFRITSNPIERSILWQMSVPDEIAQITRKSMFISLHASVHWEPPPLPQSGPTFVPFSSCSTLLAIYQTSRKQRNFCDLTPKVTSLHRVDLQQLSSVGSEVPYVLLVYQAEEFCELVSNESLIDHVRRVQSLFPSFIVCYLTSKLMSYINKCEQNQYKNSSNSSSWRRPPVEEVLSKLTTHFSEVHSRQCIDEAELAEHIVGLTSSLANCQFRKKLTQLSVYANGSIVSKDFIDRNLIKKNVWLKALVAIPKVQPRYAVAIWKKYPTMRSLLNVYMDPNKSVHQKEFLLKDLMIEGLLGKEDRRLGEMCSKRIYRILMAQSGGIKTDDVEDGADAFGC